MNKKNVLTVKNLNKTYQKKGSNPVTAIENLNLSVQQGEIFGLLLKLKVDFLETRLLN